MADKKISALTGATTPLAGTEVLPIVQGGSTVKVSVDNLTAGKAVSAASVNVTTGDVTLANNKGVKGFLQDNSAAYNLISRDTNNRVVIDAEGFGTNIGYNAEVVVRNNNLTVSFGNVIVGTAGKGIDFSANANAPGMTSEVLNWYEEGVFTLTDSGVKDAVLGTWTFVSGTYTRIGRQVTINATFSGTGLGFSANTGYYRWDGLPFASAATHSGTWQGIEAFKACAGFAFTAGSNIWLHAAITTQTSDSGIVLTATYTV